MITTVKGLASQLAALGPEGYEFVINRKNHRFLPKESRFCQLDPTCSPFYKRTKLRDGSTGYILQTKYEYFDLRSGQVRQGDEFLRHICPKLW